MLLITVLEILEDTQFVIQEDIDVRHFINLCNECMSEDIVEILKLETKATIELPADDLDTALPNDIYAVVALKAQGVNDDAPVTIEQVSLVDETSKGYQQFNKTIDLVNMGDDPYTLTLWYYRYPATITSLDDTPDFPARYHHILKYYYLSRHYRYDDDKQHSIWYEDYLKIRDRMEQSLDKLKPTSFQVIERW